MAAAVDNRVKVNLNGVDYQLVTKENERPESLKQVHQFIDTSYGAWRGTQWVGKLGTLIAETAVSAGMAAESASPIRNVAKVFNDAANGMIFGHWLWCTFEIKDQLAKEGSEANCLELFRRCVEWTTATCHSAAYFVSDAAKKTLGNIVLVTDLVNEVIESGQAASRWMEADQLLSQPNLSYEVQEGLKSKKMLNIIWLAAKVIAITAGIFGVLATFAGATALPALALAIVGFTTCTLAILKHFFKANMSMDISLKPWSQEALV